MRLLIGLLFLWVSADLVAQSNPLPCGPDNAMTSFCVDACVVCDIDGYTGINDLTATGQGFPEFCTSQYNNMQYIAFIAGTTNLTISVDVSNCSGGISSLEVGFFYTEDCENFTPITGCDTDIQSGESQTFTNIDPLIIGQHYYLIIDGSAGANCNWTFNVLEGSTEVSPLASSGVIDFPTDTCVGVYQLSTSGEIGATFYHWTVNGSIPQLSGLDFTIPMTDVGSYEVCVTASNVCDEGPPSCTMVEIHEPQLTAFTEALCPGECYEINNVDYCTTGVFQEVVILPNGCDSTIVLDLTILPEEESFLNVWICNGNEFLIGTTPYTMTGNYQQTIPSFNTCDSVVNLDLLVIECEIEAESNEVPVVCNGTASGTLIFSVTQGTAPFNYTYTNIADPSLTGMGMTNVAMNNQIDNLPAGIYQIYIEDNFGNDVVILEEVTEPSVLIVDLVPSDNNGFNVSCFFDNGMVGMDGTLIANVVGGVMPYAYNWSNGQMTQMATNLTYQEYTVTVTDAVGCPIEASFTLDVAPEMVPEVLFMDPRCEGFDTGEIEIVSVSGGAPPYTFSLDGTTYDDETLFTGLLEGSYTVYIQDANMCVITVDGMLTAPDIPVINLGPDTTIFLGDSILINPFLNDSSIDSIIWVDASTLSCDDCLDPYARPVNDTKYTLTLISDDGCIGTDTLCVRVEKRRRIYVPNAFSPNGDGLNDGVVIHTGHEADRIEFFNIYDRWGNLIYERADFAPNDFNLAWDGRFKGEKLNPAVFAWVAGVHFIDDVTIKLAGNISLIR